MLLLPICLQTPAYIRRCTVYAYYNQRERAIGSNTSTSRNSAINIPLTIHFNARSLRPLSPFSIQGPVYGLDFRFPSGSIDQIAHLGFFKVDITTDGNRRCSLWCKNCGHYSPDWPLLHVSAVGIWWSARYLYPHRTTSPLTDPVTVYSEVHAFGWCQFSYLVLKKDRGAGRWL